MTPRYSWQIDPSKLKITGHEVMQKLADTRPIALGSMGAGASGMRGRDPNPQASEHHEEHHISSETRTVSDSRSGRLKDGEDKLIAERLVEIFKEAAKASK